MKVVMKASIPVQRWVSQTKKVLIGMGGNLKKKNIMHAIIWS